MTTTDPFRASSASAPVNQFGTPITTPGAGAAHTFESAPGWPSGDGPVRPASSAGKNLGTIAILLVLVVAGGVALRHYVFPDRHKPLALPATVAGMARIAPVDPRATVEAAARQAMVRSAHGAAVDTGVYVDSANPNRLLVVSAGRLSRSAQDKQSTQPPFTELGKVTCTQTLDASALAVSRGAAATGPQTFTDRAVCWRESRALTVAVIVISPVGSPVGLASQAVSDVWEAQ